MVVGGAELIEVCGVLSWEGFEISMCAGFWFPFNAVLVLLRLEIERRE